jgi:hypothetical protein
MERKHWLGLGAALVVIIGAYFTYDALVESDEEHLESIGSDVEGTLTLDRARIARSRWIDLDRQPLEVSAMGESWSFEAGETDALDAQTRQSLQPVLRQRLRVLSNGAQIDGDHGRVRMRVMSNDAGFYDLEFDFVKHEGDWLIERVAVHR